MCALVLDDCSRELQSYCLPATTVFGYSLCFGELCRALYPGVSWSQLRRMCRIGGSKVEYAVRVKLNWERECLLLVLCV